MRTALTVSQLAAAVHDILEGAFPDVWVEGEISNCKTYPSGHTYLTLKDEASQLRAVLFKGAAWNLRFRLEDGLKVLARARVSCYPPRGDLQLILSAVEPKEKGSLQLAFEQLKAKLEAEGLFEASRKRPLPRIPQRLGVVTSLQGAALRDILSVLGRRWPALEILIAPVSVQGEAAKDEIASAIERLNRQFPELELLLVGRGGGSLEDLWAFNEEVVARAIAASRIPVISCVGHETDTTISDFVADMRAPTPSAAAELAVPDRDAVLEQIESSAAGMEASLRHAIERLGQRLEALRRHPFLQSPYRLYEERMRRVDELYGRLPEAMRRRLLHADKDLALQAQRLDAFSPLKVLGRGYAIARKADGSIVRSSRQVRRGEALSLRLAEGQILCEVSDEQVRGG
ncbi:MAG: exodeoxyribonuclease VII large subunit [Elusimicrobia bacterium]|nr:exodeoxyribonuclease VII large subunit [Elusimicrobiota bacterium]MDE2236680.1 exodeoxyribonuclease VII large subunit [Elusimicrobiota bacterium]MDE2425068.1 exodeoxyribonuclease VII large subunit [Elusimicrobiota bacterium]